MSKSILLSRQKHQFGRQLQNKSKFVMNSSNFITQYLTSSNIAAPNSTKTAEYHIYSKIDDISF